jgi:hypothetical protein
MLTTATASSASINSLVTSCIDVVGARITSRSSRRPTGQHEEQRLGAAPAVNRANATRLVFKA